MISVEVPLAPRSDDAAMPLWGHVDELRRRVIAILVILGTACAAAYPFTRAVIEFLSRPLGQLVFTRPLEAFDTRFKLSFYMGLVFALPLVLAQAWIFVGPALGEGRRPRKQERARQGKV